MSSYSMPSIVETKFIDNEPTDSSTENSDVVVVRLRDTDGKIHKFSADPRVLRRTSKKFAQLLAHNVKTNGGKIINVTDFKPHILKNFLRFLHTDEHEISSVDDGIELLKAALEFKVLPLVEECQTMLVSKMNLQNACQLYSMSEDVDLLRGLEESAINLIIRAIPMLIETPGFVNDLNLKSKSRLLSCDHLCVENETWLKEKLESLNLLHDQCPSSEQCDSCLNSVIRKPTVFAEGRERSSTNRQRFQRQWDPTTAPSILGHCERWRLMTSEMDDFSSFKCRKFSGRKKPIVTFTVNRPVYLYGYVLTVLNTKKIQDFRLTIVQRDQQTKPSNWNCVRRERILDSSFVRLTFELHLPLSLTVGTHCSLYYSNGKSSSVLPVVSLSQRRFYLDCAIVTVLSEDVFGLNCVFLYSMTS